MMNAGDATFIPENFEVFANQARNIRFTTEGMNFGTETPGWGQWAVRNAGNPDAWAPHLRNVTNYELYRVLTNPEWLSKTIFH
jgi:hypothetical protein